MFGRCRGGACPRPTCPRPVCPACRRTGTTAPIAGGRKGRPYIGRRCDDRCGGHYRLLVEVGAGLAPARPVPARSVLACRRTGTTAPIAGGRKGRPYIGRRCDDRCGGHYRLLVDVGAGLAPAREDFTTACARALDPARNTRCVDIDGEHAHAVPPGVLDQRRGVVEPHRPGVEERAQERRRVVRLEVGGGVGDEGEAGGVRLREAVERERGDPQHDVVGGLAGDPALGHPVAQLRLQLRHALDRALGAHRAPQLLRLAAREPRRHHRDLHQLLLEQRHAEGAFEHRFEVGVRVDDRLAPLPPVEVRVHHLADDRAGADDRHLDDEVVEARRAHARQRRHLRPALDLEDADGVRPAPASRRPRGRRAAGGRSPPRPPRARARAARRPATPAACRGRAGPP